jgi:predicted glycosyltransferase
MSASGTDKAPRRKVLATAGGGAFGYELGVILVYAFEQLARHDLPAKVELAGVALVGIAVGALAGYLTPAERE